MIDTINKIRRILPPRFKFAAVALGVFMGLCAILELAAIGLIMPVVSAFADPELLKSNAILKYAYDFSGANSTDSFIIRASIALVMFYLIKNLVCYIMIYLQSSFSERLAVNISDRLFRNYIAAPYSFHLDVNSAELMTRVNRVSEFTNAFLMPLMLIFSEFFVFLAIIILVVMISPFAAIFCAAAGVIALAGFYLPLKKYLAKTGKIAHLSSENLLRFLLQSFSAVREVRLAHAEDFFAKEVGNAQAERAGAMKKVYDTGQIPRLAMESFAVLIAAGVMTLPFIMGGASREKVLISGAFFIGAMFRLMPSFSRIQYNLMILRNSSYLFGAVYADLADFKLEKLEKDSISCTFEKSLAFENVSFRYPAFNENILTDFSMEIHPRECVAISGKTGCGKSTLVNLAMGFLQPTSGHITVDGNDVFSCLSSWRAKIGYVPQKIMLFDDTIRSNVAFGIPTDEINDEKVINSLKLAAAFDFVEKLPSGINSSTGEDGAHLSGGQKQRIAIARALYRNPDILILDEATSALDSETENAIMETLANIKGSLAIVMITHRAATLEYADRIIKL